MKSVGIVRKIDELGRIVLPIELRRALDLKEKDSIEITTEGETIVLKKYQQNCIFCKSSKNLIEYKSKLVCAKCASSLTTQGE